MPDLMQAGDFCAFVSREGVESGTGAGVFILNTSAQGDVFAANKSPTFTSLMDELEAAKVSLAVLENYKIRFVSPGHGEPFAMELLAKKLP